MKISVIQKNIEIGFAKTFQRVKKIAGTPEVKRATSHIRRCVITLLGWVAIAIIWTIYLIVDLFENRIVRDYFADARDWITSVFKIAPQQILLGVNYCGQLIDLIPFGTGTQKRALVGLLLLVFFVGLVVDEPETPDQKMAPGKTVSPKEPSTPALPRLTDVPDFKTFTAGQPRKDAFFSYFLPLIEAKNKTILSFRQAVLQWSEDPDSISSSDLNQVRRIATNYRIKDFDEKEDDHWNALLRRVNAIPPSLALAQAANESGWGTSRFAREANNYFGQWCYEAGCGLVPKKRDKNKTHEVAAFESPEESVARYIHNLNSNRAYQLLRDIRSELVADNEPVTGYALTEGLIKYSERGKEYIHELREMIDFNKLTRFDIN